MRNIGIPGVAGGELAIMAARLIPLLHTAAITDRRRIPVTTEERTARLLRRTVVVGLRHLSIQPAMAHTAAVAVRPLVVIRAIQAVHLVRVRELHLQAR